MEFLAVIYQLQPVCKRQ